MDTINILSKKLTLKRPNLWDTILGLLFLTVILWLMKSLLDALEVESFYHPPLLLSGLVFIMIVSIYNTASKLNEDQKDDVLQNLEKDNKALEMQNKDLIASNQELVMQNAILTEKVEIANAIQKQWETYIIQVEDAQKQSLSVLKSERGILIENLDKYKTLWLDNEYKISRYERLESENKSLESETQRLESENKSLESETQRLESENKSLESKTQRLESENKSLKDKVHLLGSTEQSLKKDLTEASGALKALEAILTLLGTNKDILILAMENEKLKPFLINLFMYVKSDKKDTWVNVKDSWRSYSTSQGMVNKGGDNE